MRSPRLSRIRDRVIKILQGLADELDAVVYLFGSYARGDHLVDSDVDIVVVCSRFEGLGPIDRVALVRLLLPRDVGFDIIALTPREFEERRKGAFFRDISRHWIVFKPSKNPGTRGWQSGAF